MSQPQPELIAAVEERFRRNDGSEFGVVDSANRSVRVGDPSTATVVVYTTKRHCLPRVRDLPARHEEAAVLGRYGLPVVEDLPFLRDAAAPRLFLGDADPVDLLAYAWLHAHIPIAWHGVNDAFLERHGNLDFDSIQIPLSAEELEALPLLAELCPWRRDLLGDYCASLIERGMKIEVEGAIFDHDARRRRGH